MQTDATEMTQPLAVFRCDASAAIGSGHVMRCLTLAEVLAGMGWCCAFLSAEGSEKMVPLLAECSHVFVSLPAGVDSAVAAHNNWPDGADLLVTDGYHLDAGFEQRCRLWAKRILAIDDLADRPHDCDILLDQNLQPSSNRYLKWIPAAATCLTGPRFSLLRPGFAKLRAQLAPRDGPIRRLLIFTGGTDPDNFAATLLGAVSRLAHPGLAVDVVMGRASPHLADIESRCKLLRDCRLHVQTPHMDELLARADLVLGSGGGNTWERCVLGVPAVMAAIAANQRDNGRMLARYRAAVFLGEASDVREEGLAHLLNRLLARPRLVRRLSKRAFGLVDGLGAARVAALLTGDAETGSDPLLLRPAHPLDMRVAFELRNEPGVYAYFFNPETVDWETHRRWFSRSLENPQRRLLIVENLRNALGVLRLDLNEDQAEVSVSLHPACQGQGFGTRALSLGTRWVRRHLPGVRRLIARIRSDNLASERAFERAGFHEHHRVYVAELGEASTS